MASSMVGGRHVREVSWRPEKKVFQGQGLGQLHQMLVISQLRYRLRTDFEIGHKEVTGDSGKSSFTGVGDKCLTGQCTKYGNRGSGDHFFKEFCYKRSRDTLAR